MNYFSLNPHMKGGWLESLGTHISDQVELHIDDKAKKFDQGLLA
jgi:hypothetical protein